jgi:hypothetical protein
MRRTNISNGHKGLMGDVVWGGMHEGRGWV